MWLRRLSVQLKLNKEQPHKYFIQNNRVNNWFSSLSRTCLSDITLKSVSARRAWSVSASFVSTGSFFPPLLFLCISMLCIFNPRCSKRMWLAVAGAPLSANKDPGRLLLLRVRSARAQTGPRPLLRGDGPQHDQNHQVPSSSRIILLICREPGRSELKYYENWDWSDGPWWDRNH